MQRDAGLKIMYTKLLDALPPPFEKHVYGNFQTLPSPMAYPRHDKMNSAALFHCPRSDSSPDSATVTSADDF